MNKLNSIVGAAAVIAIAVVFIIGFRPAANSPAAQPVGPECAVEVKGACISTQRYEAAYRLIGANSDRSRLRAIGFGRKVADGLLEAWLLGQDAKRLGLAVSDDEVTAEIAKGRAHVSLPAADARAFDQRSLAYQLALGEDLIRDIPVKNPKTKKFDAKYAEKQIRSASKMSPTEFREYQRSELLAEQVREIVRSRVRVGEREAFDEFSRETSTVTLEYTRFERRFFGDLLVDLSEKSINFWADAHKDEIDKSWESTKAQILPECRILREIRVKLGEAASDEDKAKARARIDRAAARIKAGESFADVARALSDDDNAVHGGEVGCLRKNREPKPIEDAALALAAGKVSDVVTTEAGLYLIKVDAIGKDADAEKLGRANVARDLYLAFESERLAQEASKKVAAAVKGGKSIKEALDGFFAELPRPKRKDDKGKDDKKDGKKDDKKKDASEEDMPTLTVDNHPNRPTLETSLPFTQSSDPIPGLRAQDLGQIAFGLEKPGDAPPDAIPYVGGYLAVQLKEKAPATKEQWEKSREFYVAAMRAAKASDALVAYVKRLRSQLAAEAKYTPSVVDDKAPAKGSEPDEDPGE